MRKSLSHTKKARQVTEPNPAEHEITVKPLNEDQAHQVDEFLLRSQALIERMRKRTKGKPLTSSWQLIRQNREDRFKEL